MNKALVGGVGRKDAELVRIASNAGYRLECHPGDVGGRGADGLRAVIERADLVVLQTVINSHGGMYLAKRLARHLGKDIVVLRKCGPARFALLVSTLRKSAGPSAAPEVGRRGAHRKTGADMRAAATPSGFQLTATLP